jgi:hypothetical protein
MMAGQMTKDVMWKYSSGLENNVSKNDKPTEKGSIE